MPPDGVATRVQALFLYPIKACAGLPVSRLVADARGHITGDREWAIVDAQGEVTWQGAHPRLALVRPALHEGALRLSATGHAFLALQDPALGTPRTVRWWNDSTKRNEEHLVHDAGDDAAAWLQQVTGAPLRLVRFGPQALVRPGLNPLHLVSSASVTELCAQLGGSMASPSAADAMVARLRPNVLLRGDPAQAWWPFLEERARRFHGTTGKRAWSMPVTGHCIRCVVPGVDPATGQMDDAVPQALAQLSAQRFPGGPSCFGVYAAPPPGETIGLHDVLHAELDF